MTMLWKYMTLPRSQADAIRARLGGDAWGFDENGVWSGPVEDEISRSRALHAVFAVPDHLADGPELEQLVSSKDPFPPPPPPVLSAKMTLADYKAKIDAALGGGKSLRATAYVVAMSDEAAARLRNEHGSEVWGVDRSGVWRSLGPEVRRDVGEEFTAIAVRERVAATSAAPARSTKPAEVAASKDPFPPPPPLQLESDTLEAYSKRVSKIGFAKAPS